ncbi:MAG: membrane dipeptidase [Lachnospiraceae bacterium]|nr:membrane dipeptidase [Lachnospiraceae bacterium]
MKAADMHCDTLAEIYCARKQGKEACLASSSFHVDLDKLKAGDYGLQNFAIFTNLKENGSPLEYAMELLDLFYMEMEENQDRISVVKTWKDIEENWKKGRLSAMLTIEEGGVCRGNLRILRDFYRLGVRMMTLTWDYDNELAFPNQVFWDGPMAGTGIADTSRGLTETGLAFVEEMERLGMILDISHLNDAGIYDVFRYAKKPFAASHSNARAVASHPRNLTDDMIKKLAERGGVMGINFCSAFLRDFRKREDAESLVRDMVEHIRHIKNVGGIDCIGLGTDFDGIGGRMEIDSAAGLPKLAQALEQAGFSISEIEAVFYRNVLRLYREVL